MIPDVEHPEPRAYEIASVDGRWTVLAPDGRPVSAHDDYEAARRVRDRLEAR